MPPPEKPDILSNKNSSVVEYTPEELESIKGFTELFNKAPGQFEMSEISNQFENPIEANQEPNEPESFAEGLNDDDAGMVLNASNNAPDIASVEETPTLTPAGDDFAGLDDLAPAPAGDDFGGLDDHLTPAPAGDDFEGLDDLTSVPMSDDFGDLNIPLVDGTEVVDFAENISETELHTDDIDMEPSPPALDDLSPDTVSFSTERPENYSNEPYIPPVIIPDSGSQQSHVQFSDEEIKDLRENLKKYPIQIRRLVINTVVEGKLSGDEVKQLVDSIIQNHPVEEVKKFLENKLGIDLEYLLGEQKQQIKVVVSDIDYSVEELEKSVRKNKRLKLGSIAALLFALISVALYFGAIKPWLYKRLVANAREAILNKKPYPPQLASIDKAEKIFHNALEYYPKKMYAYIQCANAYQEVGLYQNSFEKLFGKVSLNAPVRLQNETINDSKEYWKKIQNVPTIQYSENDNKQIVLDESTWTLEKKGAYLISHLDMRDDDAIVLSALGKFHSSPVKKFKSSPYRNNLLGIDYFKRILNFDVTTPLFEKDQYMVIALGGIGDVHYHQNDYYKSNEYFEKIITNQPENIIGHTGILKNLLKLYSKQKDPRLVIDYHNKIKYSIQIEDKLPLYSLANLAAFYIDLPEENDLRITYNISPKDSINAKALKSRAIELLNILYRSQRKDEYENIIKGIHFAEGYYQRGRYFRKVLNQPRVAMTQFEYAYEYNPRHFLALNDRAEILMDIHDYDGASDNLKLAIEQLSPDQLTSLGNSPDDEVLLNANIAEVYFNYGKSIYLKIIQGLKDNNFWQRIQESEKYSAGSEFGIDALVGELDKADIYFKQANSIGIKDLKRRTELNYFQGWSAYVKGNSQKALFYWDSIAPHYQLQHRNLELAKSHALYRLGSQSQSREKYLQASLGYLIFLQGYYEKRASKVLKPSNRNKAHVKLFNRLAIIENNIGAIYELLNDENKAIKHYWSSIDYSQRVSRENEVARYNIKLSFRRTGLSSKEAIPVIMDYVPPELFEVVEN